MSYFQDLPPEGKQALQAEFENPDTEEARRVEILTLLRDGADEAQMGPKCPRCRHYSFHAPYDYALIEGHIYSDAGAAEVYITGYCEFCFDEITEEPDED